MAGILEGLGAGLQGAGAILSPEVNQQQNQMRILQTQQQQQQKMLVAQSIITGLQNGAIPQDKQSAAIQALQQMGVNIPGMQATPQAQSAQQNVELNKAFLDQQRAASGMIPGGLTPPQTMGGVPVTPATLASPMGREMLTVGSQVEARKEAAQARKDQIQARYDQMEQARQLAEERMADARLAASDRAEARAQALQLQQQQAQFNNWARSQQIDLRRDALDARKEAKATAASTKEHTEIIGPAEDMISAAQEALSILEKEGGTVTGLRGKAQRGAEFLGITNDDEATRFKQTITQLQSSYRRSKLGGGVGRLAADASAAQTIIPGLEAFTNADTAKTGLKQFIKNIQKKANSLTGREVYKVESEPASDTVKPAVEAAGWSYEPDKYDYRVVDGKVQRKAK